MADEPIELLEASEVPFNQHTRAVEESLQFRRDLLHVLVGLHHEQSVGAVEEFCELLRDVPRISDEQAPDVFREFLYGAGVAIGDVPRSEGERLKIAQKIRDYMQFDAVERAVARMPHSREQAHGTVVLSVSVLADGDGGRVDVLHRMLIAAIDLQQRHENERRHDRPAVETHHERLVRAGRFNQFIERFLGLEIRLLPVESVGEGIRDRE